MERHSTSTSLPGKSFKKLSRGLEAWVNNKGRARQNEAVIRLRKKSSLLKVEDSIELCLELLDNDRQVAISCEFLATMDAMEEALRKKKISYARVDGHCTNSSQLKEAERLRYQRGEESKSSFLTSSKESRCTKGKSTTAETMHCAVKSIIICDGPPSRLTKSTDAATATGRHGKAGGGAEIHTKGLTA
jgi:hypothetical protein